MLGLYWATCTKCRSCRHQCCLDKFSSLCLRLDEQQICRMIASCCEQLHRRCNGSGLRVGKLGDLGYSGPGLCRHSSCKASIPKAAGPESCGQQHWGEAPSPCMLLSSDTSMLSYKGYPAYACALAQPTVHSPPRFACSLGCFCAGLLLPSHLAMQSCMYMIQQEL